MSIEDEAQKAAQTMQAINTPEQLMQFLQSIETIKTMEPEQKYAHCFLIVCKFLDLCQADNNLISEISINLMVSVILGEAKGNVVVAQQLIKDIVIPTFETVGDNLDQCSVVKIIADKKPFTGSLH